MTPPPPTARTGGDALASPGEDADRYGTDGWSPVPDSPAATSDSTPRIPGHVSIAPRVLTRVSGALVGEALDVDRRDVRVEAYDDAGRLALRVWTSVSIPALTADVVPPHDGVLGAIRAMQATVTKRLLQLAGREVSRVDVTVTGSRVEQVLTTGRVR